MPGLKKYLTTEDPFSSQEKKERSQRQFKNSPLYDGSYDHDALVEIANRIMLDSDEGIDFDYTKTPSWSDVKDVVESHKGKGGFPTTPWTPNQSSPGAKAIGETNFDANSIPEYDVQASDIKEDFVEGTAGTVNPKRTSKEISSTRLGTSLTLGKHPTNTKTHST